MRSIRLTVAAFAAAGGVACAGSPSGIDGETLVAGAPAQVVVEEVRWAGGRGARISTTFDSATAGFSVTRCEEAPGGPTCAETTQTHSGSALLDVRDRVFDEAATAEFRALRSEYRAPSGVTPPDYEAGSLTVTANERARTITWERGATIPPALSRFLCLVALARGELILCAT